MSEIDEAELTAAGRLGAVVDGSADGQLFELSLTGCPSLPGLLGNRLRLRRDHARFLW